MQYGTKRINILNEIIDYTHNSHKIIFIQAMCVNMVYETIDLDSSIIYVQEKKLFNMLEMLLHIL